MKATHKKISKSYATTNNVSIILGGIAKSEYLNPSTVLNKLLFTFKENDSKLFKRFSNVDISIEDNEEKIVKTFALPKEGIEIMTTLAKLEHLNLSSLLTKIVYAVKEGDMEIFEMYSEKINKI